MIRTSRTTTATRKGYLNALISLPPDQQRYEKSKNKTNSNMHNYGLPGPDHCGHTDQ